MFATMLGWFVLKRVDRESYSLRISGQSLYSFDHISGDEGDFGEKPGENLIFGIPKMVRCRLEP